MLYQMVEKSTYTSNSSVTVKSLMPICVKRQTVDVEDMDENQYTLPVYHVFVFRKEIPIILFYLAHGIDYTLDYLHVSHVIRFINKMPAEKDPEYLYFQLSSKCYLEVDKEMFNNHTYIQSVVGAFCFVCTNRTTLELLDDRKQWIKRIVTPNNYEKGYGILKYFNRLLDKRFVQVKPL